MSAILGILQEHQCGGDPCRGLPCCYAPTDAYIPFEKLLAELSYSPENKYIHGDEVIGIFGSPNAEQKLAVSSKKALGTLIPKEIGISLPESATPGIPEELQVVGSQMNVFGLNGMHTEQYPTTFSRATGSMQPYCMFDLSEVPLDVAENAIRQLADKNLLSMVNYRD